MAAISVVHARAGRIRLNIPELAYNEKLARQLEYGLLAQHGIESVSASFVTGNVLICHHALSVSEILSLVNNARIAITTPPQPVPWWRKSVPQTLALLETAWRGLDHDAVAERQRRFGRNVQQVPPQQGDLLLRQFTSFPVLVLCASAALSLATGGLLDAAMIAAVIAANAGIGFFSERSAERIIGSFIQHGPLPATVRRDGHAVEVAAEDVVPGDLLILSQGDLLAADARIIECDSLMIDESILTGESMSVAKQTTALGDHATGLAERRNMALCGTTVTSGSGIAAVVATGFSTEVGRITLAVAETERQQTPMQEQTDRLGRQLTTASVVGAASVFGFGLLHRTPLLDLVNRTVALTVAAIPEGLPAVATAILATGLQTARRHDVLIRNLNAVETLGSISVMCFDKTGTLTRNQMTATAIALNGRSVIVDERFNEDVIAHNPGLLDLLRVATLCNEAENGQGSSTENALLNLAAHAALNADTLRRAYPLIAMERRSETQRYMTTTHDLGDDRQFIAIKGNPDEVLGLCRLIRTSHGTDSLDDRQREHIQAENLAMAGDGLRVLGFACARINGSETVAPVWLGMIGMTDPARPEMAGLISHFHTAGIRTVIVTGDQIGTAVAVARQVALAPNITSIDCSDFDHISAREISARVMATDVFARVSPLHKLAVVRGLRAAGEVVAMTGDGTNDGPALRAADIGVTFGQHGTDTARRIADVVLANDDVSTMLDAVRQGRTIFANIRKAIHFLVGTNSSEMTLTLAASAFNVGQPLSPAQLLWINVLTDVGIAYALGHEEPEIDIMSQPPRGRTTPIVSAADYRRLLGKGTLFTSSAFAAHLYGMTRFGPHGGGVGMLTLLGAQLLDGFSSRSVTKSVWSLPANPLLTRVIFGLIAVQVIASMLPFTRTLLGIGQLTMADWSVITAGSIAPFLAIEALAKS